MTTLAELIAAYEVDPQAMTASAPAGLDDSRLASLEAEAIAVFAASMPLGTPNVVAGRVAMAIQTWRAASAAQAAELAEMTAALIPAATATDTVAESEVAATETPTTGPAATETVVDIPVVSQTAANADLNRTAAATETPRPRRMSMVAALGAEFTTAAPENILDPEQSAARLAAAIGLVDSRGGAIPMSPVLREVAYNLPENDRTVRLGQHMDARRAAAQMRANDETQKIVSIEVVNPFAKAFADAGVPLPTSRTAAVFCGPTPNSFDVGVLPDGGTPIYDSFPKDPASRGKFRFRPSVGLESFGTIDLDQPGIPWDASTNTGLQNAVTIACDSATVCFTPGCLDDEIFVQMLMWKYCFQYQNTAEIVDPEGLMAQMALWKIATDRQKEIIMQTYLQACAQKDNAYYAWGETTTGYGGIPDFVRLIHTVLSPAGWTGRFAGGEGYTLFMPERLGTWMALDELSRVDVSTEEAANIGAQLIQNPTAVLSRFVPGLRVVQYKDDPVSPGSFTIPNTTTTPDTVIIKPLAAATYSIAAGAGAGAAVTPTAMPAESIQTARIWLSPTDDQRIADTGVTEIGPDRVTKADCDITRVNRWERWRPYRRSNAKKTFAIDMTLEFNGARAGGVTPY